MSGKFDVDDFIIWFSVVGTAILCYLIAVGVI